MDTRLTSMAIRMAPRADRLSFFTKRPPRKMPRQAQGIAVIPEEAEQRSVKSRRGAGGHQWALCLHVTLKSSWRVLFLFPENSQITKGDSHCEPVYTAGKLHLVPSKSMHVHS